MKVRSGKIESPYKLLVYGTEGIGKSTFASQSEKPLFLELEPRTDHLEIDRLGEGRTKTFDEATKLVAQVAKDDHDYKTLVIDTIDSLGKMIEEHLCKKHGWAGINQGDAAYGNGDQAAKDTMRRFLADLEMDIWRGRGMNIILLGHAEVRKFDPPEGNGYNRFELRLKPKMAQDVREWADAILFGEYETATAKIDGKIKGLMTGNRIAHTERRAAFDAKNSWGLPKRIALDFAAFDAARKAGASTEELDEELLACAPERAAKAREWIASQTNKATAIATALRQIRKEKETAA